MKKEEKYGMTVRKIRENKGIQIKECYTGIVSRTFAYKFEKGEVNLSLQAFLEVCDNLGLEGPEEFFYLHYGRKYAEHNALDVEFNESVDYQDNIRNEKSMTFYLKYKDSNKRKEKFAAYLAHLISMVNQEKSHFDENYQEEVDFMLEYLQQMETWTIKEIDLGNVIIPFFSEEISYTLIKQMKRTYRNYRNYYTDWSEQYANSLLNIALMSFTIGRFQVGFSVIDELEALVDEFPFLNYSLIFQERMGIVRSVKLAYDGKFTEADEELEQIRRKMIVMLGMVNDIFFTNAKDYIKKAKAEFVKLGGA